MIGTWQEFSTHCANIFIRIVQWQMVWKFYALHVLSSETCVLSFRHSTDNEKKLIVYKNWQWRKVEFFIPTFCVPSFLKPLFFFFLYKRSLSSAFISHFFSRLLASIKSLIQFVVPSRIITAFFDVFCWNV